MPAGGHEVATELLATLDAEHPVLAEWPVRERVMAATWLAGYRSARTRRAYAADLATWLHWLTTRQIDVLDARRIHVDLWTRGLLKPNGPFAVSFLLPRPPARVSATSVNPLKIRRLTVACLIRMSGAAKHPEPDPRRPDAAVQVGTACRVGWSP
jgi:hypothetical protein